jgi:hypothetical protein
VLVAKITLGALGGLGGGSRQTSLHKKLREVIDWTQAVF